MELTDETKARKPRKAKQQPPQPPSEAGEPVVGTGEPAEAPQPSHDDHTGSPQAEPAEAAGDPSPSETPSPAAAKSSRAKDTAPAALTELEKFTFEVKHRRDLKPHPKNPKTITSKARKKLQSTIKRVGLIEPIVWNKRNGYLVGGHQRLSIMDSHHKGTNYRLHVAVVDMDEKTHLETMTALSNALMQGEYDQDKLKSLFADDKIGIEEAGFDLGEYYRLFGDEGFEDRAPDLEDLAERIREATDRTQKQVSSTGDRDDPGFYAVLVFKDRIQRDAFACALDQGTEQDRTIIDGRGVFDSLCAMRVIQADPKKAEEQPYSSIPCCDRCGGAHGYIPIREMTVPTDTHNFWALCPETGDPVFLYFDPDETEDENDGEDEEE